MTPASSLALLLLPLGLACDAAPRDDRPQQAFGAATIAMTAERRLARAAAVGGEGVAPASSALDYPLPPDVRGVEIPPEFFGMHLVTVWSPGTVWPPVPVGMYRMLNATPRWHDLHVARNRWADDAHAGSGMSRITAVVLFRDRYAPGTPLIYSLAGGDPSMPAGFPPWLRRARADTLEEWRRFVREVGTRFRKQIRYWEIWNEPDCICSYGGTTRQLVELTKAAAAELRAIDPDNRIIAPAFTDSGLRKMEDFLAAGGGAYADVIAWHQDNSAAPERDTTNILRVRSMMRRHGVAHLPLWTTEGHPRLQRGGDAAAIVARTHLVLWLFGVKRFHWYAWDIVDYGAAFPGPWVTLMEPGRPDVPSEAGVAYRETARWLVGARVDELRIERDVWIVTLTLPDGGPAWIVWRTGRHTTTFAVPETVSTIQTLDGAARAWQAGSYTPGPQPVLLR